MGMEYGVQKMDKKNIEVIICQIVNMDMEFMNGQQDKFIKEHIYKIKDKVKDKCM